MKNPYVLACFLLVAPAVLSLTLQEDDLVFDDVGEEGTSTAATVISRRYDERKANWFEQKYPHEIKRHQFDKVNNVPHVVVPVGHVLKLRVHKEAFTGPEDYYEVRKNQLLFLLGTASPCIEHFISRRKRWGLFVVSIETGVKTRTWNGLFCSLSAPVRLSWPISTRSAFIKRGYQTVTSSSGRCRNSLWVVNAWPSFLAMDCFRESEAKRGRKRRVYIPRNAGWSSIGSCREYDLRGVGFNGKIFCYLLLDKYLLNK